MKGVKKKTRISVAKVAKLLNYPGGAPSLMLFMRNNPTSEFGQAVLHDNGRWEYVLYAEDFNFEEVS